ncbi:Scr1 family TA system antitoxin-like transcriptional regulator [Streptomyces sp. NPDC014864]|uniref:Scr1 family TA system antitoxin-like transcriptional regulator n=1 Tax=Streptomyces sp. NPDC014864 TaxID=3364924 RepID=UPI0036F8004C
MELFRETAGLTQAQLGERVGYGEAQIAAVEQGRRIPRPEQVDAVDREEETIEQGAATRTERRKPFSRRPEPLLSLVIEEHVLRRPLGGPEVLRGQLEQLLLDGPVRHNRSPALPSRGPVPRAVPRSPAPPAPPVGPSAPAGRAATRSRRSSRRP